MKEAVGDASARPRARQARLGDGQTLVKAGLRPPPPAASALTRVWPSPSGAAREIEGRDWASIRFPPSPPQSASSEKKGCAPLTTMPPYEPGHDDAAVSPPGFALIGAVSRNRWSS